MSTGQIPEVAERCGVSVPRASIRHVLQLGLLLLPKTANPAHLKADADVDLVIADMDRPRNVDRIEDYREARVRPVFSGT